MPGFSVLVQWASFNCDLTRQPKESQFFSLLPISIVGARHADLPMRKWRLQRLLFVSNFSFCHFALIVYLHALLKFRKIVASFDRDAIVPFFVGLRFNKCTPKFIISHNAGAYHATVPMVSRKFYDCNKGLIQSFVKFQFRCCRSTFSWIMRLNYHVSSVFGASLFFK